MIYLEPASGLPHNTSDQTLKHLIGFLKYLARRGSAGFIRRNGEQSLQQLCRVIRARIFREDHCAARGKIAQWLAYLDPMPCRCGKTGSRLVGGVSCCARAQCAHTARQLSRLAARRDHLENKASYHESEARSFDALDSRRRNFHNNSAIA